MTKEIIEVGIGSAFGRGAMGWFLEALLSHDLVAFRVEDQKILLEFTHIGLAVEDLNAEVSRYEAGR